MDVATFRSLSDEELAAVRKEAVLMPALEPPGDETANFDNPPNQNTMAMVIITVTLVIATLCVILRAYARVYLLRKVGIEEVLILCAFGVYCGQAYYCYALIWSTGYFVHQWNLTVGDLIPTAWNVLLIGSFYQTVLPLLKVAILLEWQSLFVNANRFKSVFWWGCSFIIVLQIVWAGICIALLNTECANPREAIWEVWMPRELCHSIKPAQLGSGAIQLFSDVVMLLLPQRIIWTLNLSWQKRLGVSLIFGLGILACVSAGARLGVTVAYGSDPDQMYQLAPVVFWVLAETTCGFFIVCMPCLPKILKDKGIIRRFKQTLGMRVTTAGASGYGYGTSSKFSNSKMGMSGISHGSRTATATDPYHKLDDHGGIAMQNMNTESTEHLREHEDNKGKIMRTTQVTVQYSPSE